jgi:hypothetical protein
MERQVQRMGRELSDTERQILEYIYRTFKDEGCWVSSRHLVHDLQALGGDLYEIAKGIGWWLVRIEDPDSKKDALAKLTIEGVAACEDSEQDLLDFVSVLQLFVRTYRATREDVPQVTTDDFIRELNLSELQARKMAMLALEAGELWHSASYGGEGPARFELDRKILCFEEVNSFEDYREIREQDRAQRLAASSDSPILQVAPIAEPSPPFEYDLVIDEIRSTLNGLPFLKATKTHLLADFEDVARTYQGGAYKACVVMCGAVMEGLLLGNLERSKKIELLWSVGRLTNLTTRKAVRRKLREASLGDLINHTRQSNCVDGFADEIAKMVQRCRNSIHPGRVLRGDEVFDTFDKKVADLALHFLNVLCSLIAKS